MKKIKLCLIAFFAIVFASMSCAFVATSVKHAEAATEDEVKVLKSGVFAMDDSGLTLRTNDDNVGIRFKVKMSKNLGAKIQGIEGVSLKFLIAPRVVVDSVNGDYSKLVTAAETPTEGKSPLARIFEADINKMYEDGGYYWSSLVIAKTTGTNIKLDMNVVAYITYTDEKNVAQTRYATTNVEKVRGNLYNVVNSCAVINGYATDIIGKKDFSWYGSEEYPIKITTDKQAADLKKSGVSLSGKTVLSSVEFTGTEATVKTVTEHFVDENRKEIVLGGDNDTYAIDGMGVYDGTVEKATIGGVAVNYDNNGNVTLSSEFKNRLAKHGEQILSVTVKGADGNYTEYKKKLLVVTKEISNFDELKAALAFDSNNVKYGYYRLATNLIAYGGYESGNGIGGSIWKNESGDTGFRGTLDGKGFTIQETFWNTGLFGYIGKGAVIKNITFNVNKYANDKEYMLLGYSMVGATLENVNVNVTPQHGDGRTEIKSNGVSGLLTSIFANGNTFKNVVVDARDTDIDTLFGSCAYYGYTGTDTNTFDKNCKVVAQSLLGLACINNAEGVKKADSAFIPSAANLTVAKVGAAKWLSSELSSEIVLSSTTGNDYKVNLGDYTNAATILPATFGGEAVAYDKGTLTLTDEFKKDTQKHGIRNLCLIVEKDGKYYNVKTQVLVVTKEIKTPSDLSVLNGASGDKEYAIYGYYRLANDIGKENYDGINNGSTVDDYVNKGGLIGFRGTFDGNQKSISAKIYWAGIFGIVGKGAVIKDLTVNSYAYSDGRTAFAYSITGATIENVTINIKSGSSTSYTTGGGVVTATVSHSTLYKNLQVNSENEVDTLFGCSYWSYDVNKANTFDTCTINVKSIGGLICIRAGMPETIVPISGIKGLTVKTAQTA